MIRDVAWLRRFGLLAASAAAAMTVASVALWIVRPTPSGLAVALVAAALVAWTMWARSTLTEGRELRFVGRSSAGVIIAVVSVLPLVPELAPVLAFAFVLPVALAAPYLDPRPVDRLTVLAWAFGAAYVLAASLLLLARDAETSPTTLVLGTTGSLVILGLVLLVVHRHDREIVELRRAVLRDGLTGLHNRAAFLDRLEHALAGGRRRASTSAVLYLDISSFKDINDRYGHAFGDEVLRALAGRLAGAVRSSDTVARIDSDEFAVLCEDLVDRAGASVFVDRLVHSMDDPLLVSGIEVSLSLSAGLATGGLDEAPAEALLRDAQRAMDQAKRQPARGVVMYDPVAYAAQDVRRASMRALHGVHERDELLLQFQPIVRLHSGMSDEPHERPPAGTLAGLEALVRWRDPERGLRMPGEFIALAEESGDIVPLGRWVLRSAARQLRAWRELPGADGLRLMVNVSARQIEQPGFEAEVLEALAYAGLPPDSLVLELTERAILSGESHPRSVLRRLRADGIHLAIDDFGTGYSSLAYLKDLPIDMLKLDHAFLHDAIGSARSVMLIRAMIAIGAALGATVVAEGIETTKQLKLVRTLGCDLGQGFVLAPPLDAAEVARLLEGPRRPWDGIVGASAAAGRGSSGPRDDPATRGLSA